jgi:hypothetical protein
MPIANLRTFNKEELLHVLSECAHQLTKAWQATEMDALFEASFEATLACQFLRCELALTQSNYRIH